MNYLEKKIQEIAEQVTGRFNFMLIDVALKGDNRNRIVQIFVDSAENFSADDCAVISSEVASFIDSSDLIPSKYRLEVSSPGIDRPLKYLQQYPKNINRRFEVVYLEGENEIKKLSGKLLKVENDNLTFLQNDKETKINYNKIKTAKVLLSF